MIDLSNDQLQNTIHTVLHKEEGLNELLEMILNGLMKLEREAFLSEEANAGYGNGYRCGSRVDRLGTFKSVLWAMLRDQQKQVRRLCFELYGKGLTTRQVGQITEKVYGNHYSSSAVSHFNQQLSNSSTDGDSARCRPAIRSSTLMPSPRACFFRSLLCRFRPYRNHATGGAGYREYPHRVGRQLGTSAGGA